MIAPCESLGEGHALANARGKVGLVDPGDQLFELDRDGLELAQQQVRVFRRRLARLDDRARLQSLTAPRRASSGSPPSLVVDTRQTRQDSNPGLRGWSSPCSRVHHGCAKRTTRVERASPEWRSGALPTELRPHSPPGWIRTGVFCLRRAALFHCATSVQRSLRQESNPHLGLTTGACLPLTLRRRNGHATWSDQRSQNCNKPHHYE